MHADKLLEEQLHKKLAQLVAALKLAVTATVAAKLIQYILLLVQWNKSYNLTAITNPTDMLIKHIADSLVIANYLTGQCFVDVGSGAGLPGIPLALIFPEREWTLVDSNAKKTRFLIQAKALLGLDNVTVVKARVEEFKPSRCFDGVITRAWSTLDVMIEKTRHLHCADGHLWAMKGIYPLEELKPIQQSFVVYPLHVPELNEQRHLVEITFYRELKT